MAFERENHRQKMFIEMMSVYVCVVDLCRRYYVSPAMLRRLN